MTSVPPLPLSPTFLPLLCFRDPAPSDEKRWWTAKTDLEHTRAPARQFISIKSCVCVYSHLVAPPELQHGGVLFLKPRSVTWKAPWVFFPFLSPFSYRKRPHFVLTAKVTQFSWHAATTHHKSAHLTTGPQIYQPELFESGVHIVTRKEVGVLTGPLHWDLWLALPHSVVTRALPRAWTSAWFQYSQQEN